MAGLTIKDIRDAVGAQLRANLDRAINIDVDGEGKPAPVIRLRLDSPPVEYWGTFGSAGLAAVNFVLEIDPAGNDQSAVRRLDEYLSAGTDNGSSVIDALMSDTSLGGIVQTIQPDGLDYDDVDVTATLRVKVQAKKSGAQA